MTHPATPGRASRAPRRSLHGVLLLDKPLGLSSNDALQKVRRLLHAEKAGHTGTLDPLASGLLPVCFGAATKFSQASLEADKHYRATIELGVTTTTGDREGEVTSRQASTATADDIAAACARFVGAIDQVPPMHSALKHDGRALYDYARQGQEVERPARRVTIHALHIVAVHDALVTIDVHCSKGTYIRTLAEDIGRALGCGAHLAALVRTGAGSLRLADAVSLDALGAMSVAERDACLLGPDVLLAAVPAVTLPADEAGRFLTGLRRRVALADAALVRVYGPGPGLAAARCAPVFLGSGHITAGELIADRLLSPPEVAALVGAAPSPLVLGTAALTESVLESLS